MRYSNMSDMIDLVAEKCTSDYTNNLIHIESMMFDLKTFDHS